MQNCGYRAVVGKIEHVMLGIYAVPVFSDIVYPMQIQLTQIRRRR